MPSSTARKPAATKTPARSRKTQAKSGNGASAARRDGAKSLLAAATTNGVAGELTLAQIDAGHFTNPRGPVDKKAPEFSELVASIKQLGILQPIVVGPELDNGKHPIVAGWRRHAAAGTAKLAAVPVRQVSLTDAKTALVAALAENVARQEMQPLAEARAIDTLMREHGFTQVDAGKAIGMAERTVRERLRLLKIHTAAPAVGEAIDAGAVPMDAAVLLQQVAAVAPKLAAAIAAGVSKDECDWSARDLTKPVEVVSIIEWLVEQDNDVEELRAWGSHYGYAGTDLPLTDEQLARWQAIPPEESWSRQPPAFKFTDKDLEAARGAGQLLEIEYKDRWNQARVDVWIVGDEFFKGRLEDRLARLEQAGRDRAKARARQRTKEAVSNGQAGAAGLTDKQKAAAEKAKASEKRERELAHHRNAILGERSAGATFQGVALSLPAAKLLALLAIYHDGGSLLQRGARYCDAQHLTEEVKKNGSVKRSYAIAWDHPRVEDGLRAEIVGATTPEGALAPVLRACALAKLADQSVVAQSYRTWWNVPGGGENGITSQLDELVEATGLLTDIDAEAAKRADAGRPLSEVLTSEEPVVEPATPPVELKGARAEKALQLVTARPGITIPELADAMGVNQNVLYRTLPALEKDGKVAKKGRGWHPVETTEAAA